MSDSKLNVRLSGTMNVLTDLAVSPPGHSMKVGLSTVMTLPRKRYATGEETIFLPASTIRGRIRNLLTTSWMQILNEKTDKRFSPHDYLFTASGGIKDRATAGVDEREVDLAKIEQIRTQNPVVSLFGAMTLKIAGKAMITDAVPAEPIQPNHLGRSVRAHPLQRSPALHSVLDPKELAEFQRLDAARALGNIREDQAEQLEREISRLKRSPTPDPVKINSLAEEAKLKRQEADEARKIAGGAVNIQQLLGGYEAIPAKTPLKHTIDLRDVSDAELAFILLGLQLLAFDPYIGAHRSQGNGQISFRYDVAVGSARSAVVPAGEIVGDPYCDLNVTSSSDFVTRAWSLAQQYLAGEGLEAFSLEDRT